MPKRVPWGTILEIVGRFPNGVSAEEIFLALDPNVSLRTLQRWLTKLVREKKLVMIGRTKTLKYVLLYSNLEPSVYRSLPFPLSSEGEQIITKITQPLANRKVVSYNRSFLEKYQPNETFYLTENQRKKLHQMGGSSNEIYPAGTYATGIFNRLLIDLSWNSSRLEGNSYSLLETERLINQGSPATEKDPKETQMILNHKHAIEFLIGSAKEIGVNRFTILNLHAILSEGLLPDFESSGRLRAISIGISHSTYQPLAIPQVIEECFDLLIKKAHQIKDPFEQAFFLMVQIPYLQAFDDVNKRTSRLAANIPLIRHNLSPLSFIDVSDEIYINGLLGVYELNQVELMRDCFIWAYERSCARYAATRKETGEPDLFRMQHRTVLGQIVSEVVVGKMDKVRAIEAIRQKALTSIPEQDRLRFIELAERELMSLHEGNIARFKLRPTEYEAWKKTWS